MNSIELLENYTKLNNSFKKKLVFRIGISAGFFSEFNNMVLAILYCLKHHIHFELFSGDANFKIEKGWTDFFLPFCQENHDELHSKLNRRWINNENKHLTLEANLFKKATSTDYLTCDIWHKFNNYWFPFQKFTTTELQIHSRTQTAAQTIIKMIWNYNENTKKILENKKKMYTPKDDYIGFHIRAGDKTIEHFIIQANEYIKKAEKLSSIRTGFILTDDYSIFIELQNKHTAWTFFTSCSKEEKGYVHEEYLKKTSAEKTDMLYNLFAAVDILTDSQLFIGTYSSNPGMFLGMRMNKEKVFGMDYKLWRNRW